MGEGPPIFSSVVNVIDRLPSLEVLSRFFRQKTNKLLADKHISPDKS